MLNICTNLGVGVTLAGTAPVLKLSVHSLVSVFGLQIVGAHINSIVELSLYSLAPSVGTQQSKEAKSNKQNEHD